MSHNPLFPAKPAEITLNTLPQLFAHNRARFGGWTMTATAPEAGEGQQNQDPQRPDGVSEDEWNALGDPGKRALVRERERAEAAERSLAATRQRPAPKPAPPGGNHQGEQQQQKASGGGGETDIAAIVQQAVAAALKPFQEAEERRQTEAAADRVRQAVIDAAKPRLHDASDALMGIDLTAVVDDQGHADPDKIKAALDDLVTRKPHLAKSAERQAPPGIGGGAPAGVTDGEKVKAILADMQRATGVRLPAAN